MFLDYVSVIVFGIDYNDRRIIYNLYINKIAVIKTEKGNNQVEAKIAKGYIDKTRVQLFNLYKKL